jgi:hypothetical protein
MLMLKILGMYKNDGTLVFEKGRSLSWDELSDEIPPELPPSVKVELTLSFKENDLLLGRDGMVWATLDLQQAEVIQSSLLAQHINSEIKTIKLLKKKLFIIRIINQNDINEAIEFIWQGKSGLRLKPDWVYPEGEKNKSFEQWLGEQ